MLESSCEHILDDNHRLKRSSKNYEWSFNVLLIYFIIQPFNNSLHDILFIGSFLDFAWAFILLVAASLFIKKKDGRLVRSFDLGIVFIWVMYVFTSFLINGVEHGIEYDSPAAYNLRYILQSTPIFILVVVRGLGRKELNAILLAIVLVMPFSILNEYRSIGVLSTYDVQNFAKSQEGLYYNTYVPYTTFSFFAALYLFSQFEKIFIKLLIFCSFSCVSVFIFLNPSRQSVFFILLCSLVSIIFTVTTNAKNLLLIVIIVAIVAFSINRLDLTDEVSSRFFSSRIFETTRISQMLRGIDSISGPLEWALGRGLNITTEDGINPHNNYIFTTMRIGLFGTVMMFFPFFRAVFVLMTTFIKHVKQSWFDRNLIIFVINCMLFVLFHSFFGYPHLDSLNGPIVWFGLSVWVVYQREMRKLP